MKKLYAVSLISKATEETKRPTCKVPIGMGALVQKCSTPLSASATLKGEFHKQPMQFLFSVHQNQ